MSDSPCRLSSGLLTCGLAFRAVFHQGRTLGGLPFDSIHYHRSISQVNLRSRHPVRVKRARLTVIIIKAGETLLLQLPDQEQDQSEHNHSGHNTDSDNSTGGQAMTRVLTLGTGSAARIRSGDSFLNGRDPVLCSRASREGLDFGHIDDGAFGISRDPTVDKVERRSAMFSETLGSRLARYCKDEREQSK
jgi:hypothetical protein